MKIYRIILVFTLGIVIVVNSCLRDDAGIYLDTINFSEAHRILSINYDDAPDTALQQIIFKSNVRKQGYGVLLNVDQSISAEELKKFTYDFQLEDINAVHSFDIQSGETPKNNVLAALEQARFIWIFSNNMYNLSGKDCQPVIQALRQSTQSEGILVIDERNRDKLGECLSFPN